jgi:hypothetical protein
VGPSGVAAAGHPPAPPPAAPPPTHTHTHTHTHNHMHVTYIPAPPALFSACLQACVTPCGCASPACWVACTSSSPLPSPPPVWPTSSLHRHDRLGRQRGILCVVPEGGLIAGSAVHVPGPIGQGQALCPAGNVAQRAVVVPLAPCSTRCTTPWATCTARARCVCGALWAGASPRWPLPSLTPSRWEGQLGPPPRCLCRCPMLARQAGPMQLAPPLSCAVAAAAKESPSPFLAMLPFISQDKAENELLARSVPRTLNLGLMGAAVGHLLIFGPILNMVGPGGGKKLGRSVGSMLLLCLGVTEHISRSASALTRHGTRILCWVQLMSLVLPPCLCRCPVGPWRLPAAGPGGHLGCRPAGIHGWAGCARTARGGSASGADCRGCEGGVSRICLESTRVHFTPGYTLDSAQAAQRAAPEPCMIGGQRRRMRLRCPPCDRSTFACTIRL